MLFLKTKRPYAPMTAEDLDELYRLKNEFNGLLARRSIYLQIQEPDKAADCRKQAEAIQMKLFRKYDILI